MNVIVPAPTWTNDPRPLTVPEKVVLPLLLSVRATPAGVEAEFVSTTLPPLPVNPPSVTAVTELPKPIEPLPERVSALSCSAELLPTTSVPPETVVVPV